MRVTMKAARVNVGLSQAEAAKKVGISLRTLQNWEAGATCPRADKLPAICKAYNCEHNDIIFLTNNCG